MIRFLIDERLSPDLAVVAKQHGCEGESALSLRLNGKVDREVMLTALLREDIVVTNDARDDRRLYVRLARHPGLVIIFPSVNRAAQVAVLTQVIAFIEARPPVVDQMVQVRRDGTITIEPWPRRP